MSEQYLNCNRIMISATGSGRGKTTVTIGLLAALKEAGLKVCSFKCGPDYIDPMYHRSVIGVPSKNLDPFFANDDLLRASFTDAAVSGEGSINVVEGAMGLYDGIGITSEASAYSVACALDCPIILVVDAKGAGYSILATIKGFLDMDSKGLIKGVFLNRISKDYCDRLAPVIEQQCGIKVVGFLPNNKELNFESRHLGLKTPQENQIDERLAICKAAIKESTSIDGVIKLANNAGAITVQQVLDRRVTSVTDSKPVIAVAKDLAFSFYYEDNIKALELAGAEIKYFSPLKDEKLPEGTCAILLGGGYPELYDKELVANRAMSSLMAAAVEDGMPVMAECGGFMYLHYIGVLSGEVIAAGRLVRFGYINVSDSAYSLKGHEFHHFDVEHTGDEFDIVPASGKKPYKAIVRKNNLMAGFPHLYYFSDVNLPMDFVKKAAEYKNEQ